MEKVTDIPYDFLIGFVGWLSRYPILPNDVIKFSYDDVWFLTYYDSSKTISITKKP